jgi:hypothetical protein
MLLLTVALSGCATQTAQIQPPLPRNMIASVGFGQQRKQPQVRWRGAIMYWHQIHPEWLL